MRIHPLTPKLTGEKLINSTLHGMHTAGSVLHLAVFVSSFVLFLLLVPFSATSLTRHNAVAPSLNLHLLNRAIERMVDSEPVVIGVVGGSISVSSGPVHFHTQLVDWLNRFRPVNKTRSFSPHGLLLDKHVILNRALPATESDIAALCVETLFAGSIKPDILIIEYGYNDASLQSDDQKDSQDSFVNHPAANIERIIRTALRWETAVMLLEFGALDPDSHRPKQERASAGSAHLVPAQHYGVPVVDVDFWWSHWARPESVSEMDFYSAREGVHPNTNGHTIAATLILQELAHFASFIKGTVEPRDGGPNRSKSRPGFTSLAEGRALVFEIEPGENDNVKDPVLFYRRSWQPSGIALAWTTTDLGAANSYEDVVELNGSWSLANTQMAAQIIKRPERLAKGQSYFLVIKNTGQMAKQSRADYQEPYFKVYGFGV